MVKDLLFATGKEIFSLNRNELMKIIANIESKVKMLDQMVGVEFASKMLNQDLMVIAPLDIHLQEKLT